MPAAAGLLWVLAAFSPWHLLCSTASPLPCICNIVPVPVVRELTCLNSLLGKKKSKITYFSLLCQTFSLYSHMKFIAGTGEMRREGQQAQDHSIFTEIQLKFHEVFLKTLSMSQALGARYVLVLMYSFNCYCFLLPYL